MFFLLHLFCLWSFHGLLSLLLCCRLGQVMQQLWCALSYGPGHVRNHAGGAISQLLFDSQLKASGHPGISLHIFASRCDDGCIDILDASSSGISVVSLYRRYGDHYDPGHEHAHHQTCPPLPLGPGMAPREVCAAFKRFRCSRDQCRFRHPSPMTET